MEQFFATVKKEWPWLVLLLCASLISLLIGGYIAHKEVVESLTESTEEVDISNAEMLGVVSENPVPVYKPGTDEVEYYIITADVMPLGCMSATENPD